MFYKDRNTCDVNTTGVVVSKQTSVRSSTYNKYFDIYTLYMMMIPRKDSKWFNS